MRGRKPNSQKTPSAAESNSFVSPVQKVQPVSPDNHAEMRARREIYCDRIADTADAIHAMVDTLRQEGGNEALLQRAEFYFQCAFLAASWSLDLIDDDNIDFVM